jgi:hypothetical protein
MVVSAQICLTMEFAATEVSQMSGGCLLGFFSRGHGSRGRVEKWECLAWDFKGLFWKMYPGLG